jgi:hypothetical protein
MSFVSLQELVQAANRLQDLWEDAGFEFCFIGGLAVQHWGEPRQTGDVDASLWTDFGKERPVIDRLLETLSPRIEDAGGFAMLNRVLLVQEPGGVDTDVSLAAFPFERDVIDRAEPVLVHPSEPKIRLCDASDLVILKAFANRPRDWQDIRGVLIRSSTLLDWHRILSETTTLASLKEEPEILDRLNQLRLATSH